MKPTTITRPQKRKGVASFELVMSFPILMFLIAMLYTAYIATIMKSQLTMEVRHNAWLVRSTPKAGEQSKPFGLLKASESGKAYNQLTRKVAVYRNWYPSVPRNIRWGNVILVGSWDHRFVEFPNSKWAPIYPHVGVLKQMITGGGPSGSTGEVNQLGQLGKVPGLP